MAGAIDTERVRALITDNLSTDIDALTHARLILEGVCSNMMNVPSVDRRHYWAVVMRQQIDSQVDPALNAIREHIQNLREQLD